MTHGEHRQRPCDKRPFFVFWREPETNAQRAKGSATQQEAKAFRDTVSTDLRHGTFTDSRPIAFKVFAEDWLVRTKSAVSANTGALYEWATNMYLVPAFGLTPIQSLTAENKGPGGQPSRAFGFYGASWLTSG